MHALETWMKPKRFVTMLLLKILNSIFQSISMGVDHKLLLQQFVIDFSLFCSKARKIDKYKDNI